MSAEPLDTGNEAFPLARRGGYEREEVDAYIAQLQRRIADLEARRTPEDAIRRALEQVGEEVTAVLTQAHESARAIVEGAEHKASAERLAAAQEAAALVARAQEQVRELDLETDRIWAERERLVADARDLARQLSELADSAAARFPVAQPGSAMADGL
jgi:cell division septum initiation protein DivIVA